MDHRRSALAAILMLVVGAGCSQRVEPSETARFHRISEQFLTQSFERNPVRATRMGVHAFDGSMGRFDAEAMRQRAVELRAALSEAEGLAEAGLDESIRLDRLVFIGGLKSELIEIEETRSWQKDPGFYANVLNDAFQPFIERPFVPKSERLRLLIAREREVPALLRVARENLSNAAPEFIGPAKEQFDNLSRFFSEVLPSAFEDSAATELFAEFRAVNKDAVRSIREFARQLDTEIAPRATADFRWGAPLLHRKLMFAEATSVPVTEMEERATERLVELQGELTMAARAVHPGKSTLEVLEDVARAHPKSEELIPTIRGLLEDLRAFCVRRGIVTIPSEVRCEVTETAPFARVLSLGSLDVPGPFDANPQEAYYKVSLPDPSWPAARRGEHLRFFNEAALPTIAAYETYPGRYLHYLWSKSTPSRVQRLYSSEFMAVGWGHYAESVLLDQGYKADDHRVRVAHQRNALLRLARFITAVRLHTGRMTPEEATQFFIKEAYLEPANALRETRRSMTAPFRAMSYWWGKTEIEDLRADYQRLKGNSFRLREFHDALLRLGRLPIPLARRILLVETPPS